MGFLTRLCFAALAAAGMTATSRGPTLDPISLEYGLSLTATGFLLLLSSIGYLGFTVGAGMLSKCFGRRSFLLLAFILLTAGNLAAGLGGRAAGVFAGFFLTGLALGGMESVTVTTVNDLNRDRPGMALNFSQVFWSLGALLGPLAAGWLGGFSWRFVYLAGVPAGLFLAALFRSRSFPGERGPAGKRGPGATPWKQPAFLLLAVSMVFYVGTEMTVAGWLALYMSRSFDVPLMVSSLSLSLFWGAMTAGRVISGFLAERVGYEKLVLLGSGSGFACLLLAVASVSPGPAMFFFAATGFCYSSLWPTLLACAGKRFPRDTAAVFGVMIGAGGLGALVFPPLAGLVADRTSLSLALGGSASLLLFIIAASAWLLKNP